MCQLGNRTSEELIIPESEAIIGYRGWYINDKFELTPLNQNKEICYPFDEPLEAKIEEPFINSLTGIYAYNNYYNYYHYNNYNYYNYNNYYYVAGTISQFGRVVNHDFGQRSTFVKPNLLVKLTPVKGLDYTHKSFLVDFNSKVEKCAELYNIPTINHADFK